MNLKVEPNPLARVRFPAQIPHR